MKVITQRELRNKSGDVMREIDRGQAFLVTRNGVPVAELTPVRRGALAFGSDAARAYGRVFAATVAAGRQPRRRVADLFIAATAVAEQLPLYTRSPADFLGLEDLLRIVTV